MAKSLVLRCLHGAPPCAVSCRLAIVWSIRNRGDAYLETGEGGPGPDFDNDSPNSLTRVRDPFN